MNTLTTKEQNRCGDACRIEYVAPRVNLHEDADGYTIEAEVPGVAKDGVEITFDDGELTVTGRRVAPAETGSVLHRERSLADYRRVFDLATSIDADAITATVEQGLLTIRLPKAEAAKPRKIAVS